jgi:glycosyltransferase involved in cell wall biosynthesis
MIPLSVITVCYNPGKGFEATHSSVEKQSCRDFEWIIVDGKSSDGTRETVMALADRRVHVLSEPDLGIYDAMNKGLDIAQGKRVWFMNAGDLFHDDKSIEKVNRTDPEVEICYGEALVRTRKGDVLGLRSEVTPHRTPVSLDRSCFSRGMVVSHQAFIPLRGLAPKYQYSRYKYGADLDWMLEILQQPRTSVHLGNLAIVEREGATMDHWYRSQFERFLILGRHFGWGHTILNHARILSRRIFHARNTGLWR